MSVQLSQSMIDSGVLDTVRARAKAGAFAELESLLWFREHLDDWKVEGVLMQAYAEYASAMMISRDTLRRKMWIIRAYSPDDLERWIENGVSFDHMENANTIAELAKKTPKQLLDECISLGDENGNTMTVEQMISFALSEKPPKDRSLFRVNALFSRFASLPALFGWDVEKRTRFETRIEELRKEFFS